MSPPLARSDVGVDQHRDRFEPGDDDALRRRDQDGVVIVLISIRLFLTSGRRPSLVAATGRTPSAAAGGARRIIVVVVDRRDVVRHDEVVIEVGFVQMVAMARTPRTTGTASAPPFASPLASSRTGFTGRAIFTGRTFFSGRSIFSGRTLLANRSIFASGALLAGGAFATGRAIFTSPSIVAAWTSLALAATARRSARLTSDSRLTIATFGPGFPIATSGAFTARRAIGAAGCGRGRSPFAIAATAVRQIVQIVFGRVDQREIILGEIIARRRHTLFLRPGSSRAAAAATAASALRTRLVRLVAPFGHFPFGVDHLRLVRVEVDRTLDPRRSLDSLRTLTPFRTLGALGAFGALRSLAPRRPLGAFRSFGTLAALGSFRTFGSIRTGSRQIAGRRRAPLAPLGRTATTAATAARRTRFLISFVQRFDFDERFVLTELRGLRIDQPAGARRRRFIVRFLVRRRSGDRGRRHDIVAPLTADRFVEAADIVDDATRFGPFRLRRNLPRIGVEHRIETLLIAILGRRFAEDTDRVDRFVRPSPHRLAGPTGDHVRDTG